MAHIQGVRARVLVQPPRGTVILALAFLSWALFWAAGSAIVTSFGIVAGA